MNSNRYARLVAALHERALGTVTDMAAVDLITRHGVWLSRPDFRRFIQTGRCCATSNPMAEIRWRAAVTALNQGRLSCSGAEADTLRIAASIGADVPVRLRDVLGNLDHRTIALVTGAIAAANGGWPISPRNHDDR